MLLLTKEAVIKNIRRKPIWRKTEKHLVCIIFVWVNVRKVDMQTIGIIARNVTNINQEQECDI
jgi:hypothetical protein